MKGIKRGKNFENLPKRYLPLKTLNGLCYANDCPSTYITSTILSLLLNCIHKSRSTNPLPRSPKSTNRKSNILTVLKVFL